MNPLKKIWWVCVVCVFFGFQVPDLRSYLVVRIIGWLWGIEGIEQIFLSRTPPHEHGLSRHYPCRLCFCGFQKWRTTLHEVKQCCGVKLSFSLKTTLFWVKVYVMRFGKLLNPNSKRASASVRCFSMLNFVRKSLATSPTGAGRVPLKNTSS